MPDLDQIENLEAEVGKQRERIATLEAEVQRLSEELRRVPNMIRDHVRRYG